MKNQILLHIAVVIALLFLLHYSINSFIKKTMKHEDKIGFKVVIQKDTLIIVDYSILNENYILSDGKEISRKLLDKIQVIKP